MAALRGPRRESAFVVGSRAMGQGPHRVANSSGTVPSPAPGMRSLPEWSS